MSHQSQGATEATVFGGRPVDPRRLRVACVLDDALAACLRPECELIELRPDTWRSTLEEQEPDLLLVEAAWAGTSGSWQYQVATYEHPGSVGLPHLTGLVEWCRRHEVPTAFWNGSHPRYLSRFIPAAALFDHLFTSYAETVPSYRRPDEGRPQRIGILLPAVQPRLHNPTRSDGKRSGTPVFVATAEALGPKEAERLDEILAAASAGELVAYELLGRSSEAVTGLPAGAHQRLVGDLRYERTADVYRDHSVVLSGEPALDSPTMVSPRVFEALACEAAVLSTPSAGLSALFSGLVATARTSAEATDALDRLANDSQQRRRDATAARRAVLSAHTYRDRLATLARALGYDVAAEAGRELTVIALVDDLSGVGRLGRLTETLVGQSMRPTEMLVGLTVDVAIDGELHPLAELDGLGARTVHQDAALPRVERYRELAKIAGCPWVAPVDPLSGYGRHHLADLVAAASFAAAEVVGAPVDADEHGPLDRRGESRYVDTVHPDAALIQTRVAAEVGWTDELPSAWDLMRGIRNRGGRCYGVGGMLFEPAAHARR